VTATVDDGSLARRLADLIEQQRAVSGVLRALARSTALQPVLDEVVDACRRLTDGHRAQLWLLQEDGLLHVVADKTPDDAGLRTLGYDKEHPHVLDRTTVVGRAALERRPVVITDIEEDAEYTYAGPRTYRAMIGAPVMVEDELIGAVAAVRAEPGTFTDEHVAILQTFADQAAIAIFNARLIEAVARQRTELSRFLSPQVAELISSKDGEQLLAGHRAYISCLFCDLRGFTAFAETAAPEDLFEVLREYHSTLGELIAAHDGTLEHFAGDGVMVFFNDPAPVADHELEAVRFALAAQERFAQLADRWRRRGIDLGLGIGIESGYATLGRIGFEGRYDYGALGPVTNLASRLSTAATGGQTLVGQRLYAAVEDRVEAKPVGELELKGFGRAIPAHEVTGIRA
jgi:class 3 adenylate cyclase